MFEFNDEKSAQNKLKHGIDFIEAQRIWKDANRIEVPAKNIDGEERWIVIGKISPKVWAAAITYRSEKTRIISVRRARKKEVDLYENARL